MKRATVVMVLFVAVAARLSFAQTGTDKLKSELEALHNEWFAAFDRGDGAAMDRLEVENLQIVMPMGTIWRKSSPRAGGQTAMGALSRRLSNVEVRQFGETAILTGTLSTIATKESKPDNDGTTVVFVRRAGRWLIASAQWTPEKPTSK